LRTYSLKVESTWQLRLRQTGVYLLVIIIMLALPAIVSDYIQSMIVKILIFAIFAMSLNLLWGYTGLTSLGHAAYFGVAGYTVGILTVVLGLHNFWLTALAGIIVAAITAAVFAFPALRMANTPIKAYFLLVTLALGELLASIAEKWRAVTGGDNGLAGIPLPELGFGLTLNGETFYYLVFIIFAICVFLLYRISKSPFGEALQGIRENELRMRSLGYHTWLYKYMAFLMGGAFAGVGGVLFSHFAGIMAPMHVGIMTSTLVLLMVIIGSSNTIYGPVLGAAIVLILEHVSSIYAPDRWPLVLGAVFVISVMFLRGGISIHLLQSWKKITRKRPQQPKPI